MHFSLARLGQLGYQHLFQLCDELIDLRMTLTRRKLESDSNRKWPFESGWDPEQLSITLFAHD
jgi:hypothetical protein